MRGLAAFVLWMTAVAGVAQEGPRAPMTQQRLHQIIAETGRNVCVEGNVVAFQFGEVALLCISDPNADRMRIITPVKRVEEATSEEILAAMQANFHSALDARHAIWPGVRVDREGRSLDANR